MKECSKECMIHQKKCKQNDCRMWIDYKEDLNCALITVNTHDKLTLREVGERLKLSTVRIKQIQDVAQQKLLSKLHDLDIDISDCDWEKSF